MGKLIVNLNRHEETRSYSKLQTNIWSPELLTYHKSGLVSKPQLKEIRKIIGVF